MYAYEHLLTLYQPIGNILVSICNLLASDHAQRLFLILEAFACDAETLHSQSPHRGKPIILFTAFF